MATTIDDGRSRRNHYDHQQDSRGRQASQDGSQASKANAASTTPPATTTTANASTATGTAGDAAANASSSSQNSALLGYRGAGSARSAATAGGGPAPGAMENPESPTSSHDTAVASQTYAQSASPILSGNVPNQVLPLESHTNNWQNYGNDAGQSTANNAGTSNNPLTANLRGAPSGSAPASSPGGGSAAGFATPSLFAGGKVPLDAGKAPVIITDSNGQPLPARTDAARLARGDWAADQGARGPDQTGGFGKSLGGEVPRANQGPAPEGRANLPRSLADVELPLGQMSRQALLEFMNRGGLPQPVMALIAADMFRIQSARLELLYASRAADEDGELPPLDEDEAAMRQRAIAGVDLPGMGHGNPTPRGATAAEEDGPDAGLGLVAFRSALLTAGLQAPQNVLPMFRHSAEERSVRLFRPTADAFVADWVTMLRPAEERAWSLFEVGGKSATWIDVAEAAYAQATGAAHDALSQDAAHNAAVAGRALESIFGRAALSVTTTPNELKSATALWKLLCRANTPRSQPLLVATVAAPPDGFLPSHVYGVLGTFVRDRRWMVALCNGAGEDAFSPACGVFSVPFVALQRNVGAVALVAA